MNDISILRYNDENGKHSDDLPATQVMSQFVEENDPKSERYHPRPITKQNDNKILKEHKIEKRKCCR